MSSPKAKCPYCLQDDQVRFDGTKCPFNVKKGYVEVDTYTCFRCKKQFTAEVKKK